MTTTLLDPTGTLTPEPPPDIRVRDLIEMLQREDPDAYVQVVTRVRSVIVFDEDQDRKLINPHLEDEDETENRYCEGIEVCWYAGRKVVVVR